MLSASNGVIEVLGAVIAALAVVLVLVASRLSDLRSELHERLAKIEEWIRLHDRRQR